jgi:hypothetical protein
MTTRNRGVARFCGKWLFEPIANAFAKNHSYPCKSAPIRGSNPDFLTMDGRGFTRIKREDLRAESRLCHKLWSRPEIVAMRGRAAAGRDVHVDGEHDLRFALSDKTIRAQSTAFAIRNHNVPFS